MTATHWQSIVVAVRDPAARKQMALKKAVRIAKRTRAKLTLFHAFSRPLMVPPDAMPIDPDALLRDVAKGRRAELLALAKPLRKAGLTVRCVVIWDFPPAHAIVRYVRTAKPDLVVAESHRHSRIARWFLANSDWDLIRECPCPVWFVKQDRLRARPTILAAVDPSHAHAKPSALDDRLLDAAESVQAQLGGRVVALHVQDTLGVSAPTILAEMGNARALVVPAAAATAAIARLGKRHGLGADDQLVRTGVPTDVIAKTAREMNADLLVMGAISRSGQSHFHIGNTAEAVIDEVACDVLIVKPRGFKSAVPRKGPKVALAKG
jgi:universal stress protein E